MAKGRIFVADDEARFRDELKSFFESRGYIVDLAANYRDASALLDEHEYLLIVCDNGMPLADESRPNHRCGLQLLARAKMHGPNEHTPFILNTGDDMERTKTAAAKLGGIYRYKTAAQPLETLLDALST